MPTETDPLHELCAVIENQPRFLGLIEDLDTAENHAELQEIVIAIGEDLEKDLDANEYAPDPERLSTHELGWITVLHWAIHTKTNTHKRQSFGAHA